ncbi:DUF4386 family protein [Agromyces soli]
MSARRGAAILAGVSIALMALLAPLGLLMPLAAGETGIAAVTVLAIATLDVVAGIALYPVLAPGGVLLAQLTAATRVAYGAAFAAAGGFLYAPTEPGRFDAAWEAALLIFGLHLVLLGAAVIRTADAPTFIGALVVIAGAGYSADAVSAALSPHAPLALGEFTFVGEIVLMVWLIGWAARGRSRAPLELADTSG